MLGLGRTGETSAAVGTSGPALSNEVTPGGDRKDARALPLVSLHQAAVRLIKAYVVDVSSPPRISLSSSLSVFFL